MFEAKTRMTRLRLALSLAVWLALLASQAGAEPAKRAFGAATAPTSGPAAAHGGYSAGCMAGAVELPESGPGWQAMRLSRNRNWGHPELVAFVERLSRAAQGEGWAGLLVGDISQPRGGPMTSGHKSHQIGLDADIWMRPAERLDLSREAREALSSDSVVASDRLRVNGAWTEGHARILRAAASDPAVARIFVNAAIKRELCRAASENDREWMRKIRPWWKHDSHFHVRLACPVGEAGCVDQAPPPPGDGCDETLEWWFSDEALNPPPPDPDAPPPRDLTLSDLPPACRAVLEAG